MLLSQFWTDGAGYYCDTAPLGARVESTPAGGLRIPSHVTRSGVFTYTLTDGTTRREWRPPEEVFHPDSLASLRDAPVTIGHPDNPVDPVSWNACARGHVGGPGVQDGDHVLASVVVSDAEGVQAVRARDVVETSCGYRAGLEMKAGITPQGEAYDAIQRNIRYNHVALGPAGWGRGGSTVRLLLDAKTAIQGISMPTEKTDPTPNVAALQADLAKATARADAAEAAVHQRAVERADLLVTARHFLGSQYLRDKKDAAATSNADVIGAILSKALPGADFQGKSEDFLFGALFAIMSAAHPGEAPEATEAPAPAGDGAAPPDPPATPPPAADPNTTPPPDRKTGDSRVMVVDHRQAPGTRPDPIAELRDRNQQAWKKGLQKSKG